MWQAALPSLESQFAMTKRAPAKRPPIYMIDTEADTTTDLALARQEQTPEVDDLMLQEIDRAMKHTEDKVQLGRTKVRATVTNANLVFSHLFDTKITPKDTSNR